MLVALMSLISNNLVWRIALPVDVIVAPNV
jgi:hypothetical protein